MSKFRPQLPLEWRHPNAKPDRASTTAVYRGKRERQVEELRPLSGVDKDRQLPPQAILGERAESVSSEHQQDASLELRPPEASRIPLAILLVAAACLAGTVFNAVQLHGVKQALQQSKEAFDAAAKSAAAAENAARSAESTVKSRAKTATTEEGQKNDAAESTAQRIGKAMKRSRSQERR